MPGIGNQHRKVGLKIRIVTEIAGFIGKAQRIYFFILKDQTIFAFLPVGSRDTTEAVVFLLIEIESDHALFSQA